MHEFGLCESILDAVTERAHGRPVLRIRVRIGVLLRVAEPVLEQAFSLVARNTVAENATIDVSSASLNAACRACGAQWEDDELPAVCSSCGGTDIGVSGGDEVILESIVLAETAANE